MTQKELFARAVSDLKQFRAVEGGDLEAYERARSYANTIRDNTEVAADFDEIWEMIEEESND